jgi:hypothetical protein
VINYDIWCLQHGFDYEKQILTQLRNDMEYIYSRNLTNYGYYAQFWTNWRY